MQHPVDENVSAANSDVMYCSQNNEKKISSFTFFFFVANNKQNGAHKQYPLSRSQKAVRVRRSKIYFLTVICDICLRAKLEEKIRKCMCYKYIKVILTKYELCKLDVPVSVQRRKMSMIRHTLIQKCKNAKIP